MKLKSGVFERLAEENTIKVKQMEIPRNESYFLKRVIAELTEKSKPYFEEKQAIIDKYKENGNKFIPSENVTHYLNELSVIMDTEIEINFEKRDINLNDLPEKISMSQIDFLELFFNIKE